MNRRRVLITGAARRVGRAIALHLAHNGFDITLTYLSSRGEAETLVSELQAAGAEAEAISADLAAGPDALAETAKRLVKRPIDVLINNASVYLPDSADAMAAERMWRIHVLAPGLLTRACAPSLRAARGCVINLCDILAERPMRGYLAYCSSKAGLVNLTRGLARELAPGIRVNGIAPGVAQWPEGLAEDQKEAILRRTPLGRAGTPQDIADTALFLINSPYITGQIINVDGGRSIA